MSKVQFTQAQKRFTEYHEFICVPVMRFVEVSDEPEDESCQRTTHDAVFIVSAAEEIFGTCKKSVKFLIPQGNRPFPITNCAGST